MRRSASAAGLALACLAATSPAPAEPPLRAEVDGVGVEVSLGPGRPRAGEDFTVELALRDVASGRPLTAAKPAAWLARRDTRQAPTGQACKAKAAAFLGGGVFDRPAADLNGYYVLVLNDNASVSVVDPRFSFGGSRLLALLRLEAPGSDWVASADGSRLLVSLPSAGKVALADLVSWTVRDSLDVGPDAGALLLEPGGEAAWVATRDGIVSFDARTLARRHSLALGAGTHALAVDPDGRHVFATAGGGVAVVDTRAPERLQLVPTGGAPTTLAHSSAAGFAYAGDPASGDVVAVDPARAQPVARFTAEPGFTQVRFAPGGRLGFLPNPERDIVQVFDAAHNRLVRTIDVKGAPDQVTFSDHLAYVRRRGSETVVMIPLAGLEREGPTGIADFPGGEHPLGAPAPALADSIVAAPEGTAVLVANPRDRTVYYYREGMAAPMGGFAAFSRQPRALLVVDRSLRERPGGRYAAATRLGAGTHDLVVFLDAPRLVACFELTVAGAVEAGPAARTQVELVGPSALRAGAPGRVRVRLRDAASGRPRSGLDDVEGLVVAAPGVWQRRLALSHAGDGQYEAEFTPPRAGAYSLWVESGTAELALPHSPSLMLAVAEGRDGN